jgi:hypothetical protein
MLRETSVATVWNAEEAGVEVAGQREIETELVPMGSSNAAEPEWDLSHRLPVPDPSGEGSLHPEKQGV